MTKSELYEQLVECLKWYVAEDDINEGDSENEYWIAGKNRAKQVLKLVEEDAMGIEAAKIHVADEGIETPRAVLRHNLHTIVRFMGQEGVDLDDILGRRKHKRFMAGRSAIARYLKSLGWSYVEIGRLMGGRDHTSIIHCVNKTYFDGQLELEKQVFKQLRPVAIRRGQ